MEPSSQDRDEFVSQTEKILASRVFSGSERMSRFLRYLVTESVAGRGEQLKEYTIALEVFQRPSTFDPRVDSTVRSEASRLRAKLQLYYEAEGSVDPILISIPKGSYVTVFKRRKEPRLDETSMKRPYAWLAFVCLAAIAGGTSVWWWLKPHRGLPDGRGTVVRLTSDAGLTAFPAISAEGRLVAYASDRSGRGDLDIWIQPTGSKDAIRLTDHEADDYDPAFSPDTSQIAFRSDRDGGGIYLVPVLGGHARLVAREGSRPRFSSDGLYLAYSAENRNFRPHVPDSGKTYVVTTVSGGPPVELQPQFTSARSPIWSPDGKHVLFAGVAGDRKQPYDWWVSPVPHGKAVRTGIVEVLLRSGLVSSDELPFFPAYWAGNTVVFSARTGDSVNLWRIPISMQTWHAAGGPQRLTFGAGPELQAAASRAGQMAFTNANPNLDIWALPIDAELGQVMGSPTRMTNSTAADHWPSVSVDGKKVLFSSNRSGKVAFWLKNLENRSETELATGGTVWASGVIEKDGNSLVYYSETQTAVLRMDISTGDIVKVCNKAMYMGETPDRSMFLHGADGQIKLRELKSGRDIEFLKHPKFQLHQAQLSTDGDWVVFYARTGVERSQIFIAPFREGHAPVETGWIPITTGKVHETCPAWSPDGNFVYFGSNRDGFNCIWGQRLHSHSKRPVGPAVGLAHFHAAARRLGNVGVAFRGLSVARDKIVFTVEERIGNIWLMR